MFDLMHLSLNLIMMLYYWDAHALSVKRASSRISSKPYKYIIHIKITDLSHITAIDTHTNTNTITTVPIF